MEVEWYGIWNGGEIKSKVEPCTSRRESYQDSMKRENLEWKRMKRAGKKRAALVVLLQTALKLGGQGSRVGRHETIWQTFVVTLLPLVYLPLCWPLNGPHYEIDEIKMFWGISSKLADTGICTENARPILFYLRLRILVEMNFTAKVYIFFAIALHRCR